jgi:hypothetical protein
MKLYIDFEFNQVTSSKVNLVCAATVDSKGNQNTFWLHGNNQKEIKRLIDHINKYEVIVGYSCVAEARSFIAMGLDPLDYVWKDLFYEYRMITNHNDNLIYGKQLVNGRIKDCAKPPPKWARTEEDEKNAFRPTHSLVECTYKLLKIIRDNKHKDQMRDLIISDPKEFSSEEKKAIMDYCLEDVVSLPDIEAAIFKEFSSLVSKQDIPLYNEETYLRGRFAAHTAIMENRGYCIDYDKVKNFSEKVSVIMYETQRDINNLFQDIKPFKWNKAFGRFSLNEANVRKWISETQDVKRWLKTESGKYSLSLDAFEKEFSYRHDYPESSFGAQMLRYLKLKQSLYGFSSSNESSSRKSFWDSVGPDKVVRPYLNSYQAQSSRSQPASSGFMFLKPAWMRAFVVPPKGYFYAGIDYGAQEFFAAALLSQDENMIKAYLSGDPYLAFAKDAEIVPQNATKESHEFERNYCKSCVLGIGFLMTKIGLAKKLSQDTGKVWTEDMAQELINSYYEVYPCLKEYQDEIASDYIQSSYIKLPCGWYMFGDNDNHRSVANVPIQGFGASVMRKAIDIAVSRGVEVIFPLHDAIYMQGKLGEENKIIILRDSMRDAFTYYFNDQKIKEAASKIRLDPVAWSPSYRGKKSIDIDGYNIPLKDIYIDKRAIKDYERFKKYFENDGGHI